MTTPWKCQQMLLQCRKIAGAAYSEENEGKDYSCAAELQRWEFSKQVCKYGWSFTVLCCKFPEDFAD